jgi:hypothetical protein
MNSSITDKSAGLDGSILSMFVHSRVVPVVVRTHLDTAWRQFGTSTRNHKSLSRRPLTRRWWTFDLVHMNGSAVLL